MCCSRVNTRTACFSRRDDEAMELQALGHTLTKDTKELGERSRGQKPLLCVVVSRPDRISLDLAKVGHKESFHLFHSDPGLMSRHKVNFSAAPRTKSGIFILPVKMHLKITFFSHITKKNNTFFKSNLSIFHRIYKESNMHLQCQKGK